MSGQGGGRRLRERDAEFGYMVLCLDRCCFTHSIGSYLDDFFRFFLPKHYDFVLLPYSKPYIYSFIKKTMFYLRLKYVSFIVNHIIIKYYFQRKTAKMNHR